MCACLHCVYVGIFPPSFLPSPLSPSLTLSPPPSLSPSLPPLFHSPSPSLSGEGFNMEAGQLFCGGCYGESYGASVEGVDQRLEETSCGWRLWISSGTLTASLALSECVLFRCVCSTVCIARHLCVWIVDHVAHVTTLHMLLYCILNVCVELACWSCQINNSILYNIPKR